MLRGRAYPLILSSINSLTSPFDNWGKVVEAEQMHWQALELSEMMLGRVHLDFYFEYD
jgi:hypothetical protein